MYEILLQFHDRALEDPPHEGNYLVVVKEKANVTLPETELDSLIFSVGGSFYSIAHWDGEEWDGIYLDDVIVAIQEDDTFQVRMWTDRTYDLV